MATAPPLRTPGAAAEPPGLRGGRGVPAPPEPPGHLERGATGGGEAAAPAPEVSSSPRGELQPHSLPLTGTGEEREEGDHAPAVDCSGNYEEFLEAAPTWPDLSLDGGHPR
ncbi:uncharacterized protein LOC126643131 isoform X2 [Myiozetetes cayanensis]|uniref:uncharacterized protein LOC126643131 isoform X2 n=1 Tax=Myiozetetes cayanensis TaxID=478635 RepID=UPI002160336B|nr:uncharacterized protein LOC126643131 isoform X2 [Myiozetetes cayanensis]